MKKYQLMSIIINFSNNKAIEEIMKILDNSMYDIKDSILINK